MESNMQFPSDIPVIDIQTIYDYGMALQLKFDVSEFPCIRSPFAACELRFQTRLEDGGKGIPFSVIVEGDELGLIRVQQRAVDGVRAIDHEQVFVIVIIRGFAPVV